ncbi:MAG TPA: T9SS type A sorting domain-containing protein [Bacteroidia bacterium]|nr:T9SS type A sorting domain-containing protein [Bacteroidia bacterium]
MKKITSALAIACLGISTMVAQTQRTILYEEFTGENCGPCASTNPGLTSLMHSPGNYPDKILMVRYQCNIPSAPGAGSLYQDNPTEVATRQTYYSVPFAPYARFNGIVLPDLSGGSNNGHAGLLTQTYINDSSIVNAPFSLGIVYGFSVAQDSVIITATITAAQAFNSSSLLLHMAMEEAQIHFTTAPGSNGEKDFYDVMRKMVPSAAGTVLNAAWTNGQSQVITLKAKLPTYIKNKNQLCFVGWIQDNTSKRVHQAAYGKLNLDMGALGLGVNASCTTTFAPSVTVKNCGTNTITSYSLTYKIDAGTVTTIAGTGTPLAGGATTTVMLPSGTYAIGTHTVTANTSMPNGSPDMFVGNDAIGPVFFYVFGSTVASPVIEGFQSGTFPPTNWGIINGGSAAYTWASAAYGGYQASSTCSFMDWWDAPAGDVDEMVLPAVNMSTLNTAQMTFDIAKGMIPGQADRLQILASSDCGVTWVTMYDKDDNTGLSTTTYSTAAYFPAASTEWRTDNVNFNAFAGKSEVMVKFVGTSAYSQNIFIDNINLSGTTGIKTVNNVTNLSVYPNPASSEVNLTVSLIKGENVSVHIYNNLGELVYSDNKNMFAGDNHIVVNSANLANGMYTVTVSAGTAFSTKKLTISK